MTDPLNIILMNW